jgi:hypothetical protein
VVQPEDLFMSSDDDDERATADSPPDTHERLLRQIEIWNLLSLLTRAAEEIEQRGKVRRMFKKMPCS